MDITNIKFTPEFDIYTHPDANIPRYLCAGIYTLDYIIRVKRRSKVMILETARKDKTVEKIVHVYDYNNYIV